MRTVLPSKIEHCPIIDALIEIRFNAKINRNAVFGVIYNLIMDVYTGAVTNLPILQIPEPIRDADPNLKYKPLYRIENERFIIQIGPDVLCISSKMPYKGWEEFSDHTISIIDRLRKNVIGKVIRLGHRYINFFEGDITNDMTMSFSMTEGYEVNNLLIGSGIKDGEFINTLQFSNNATYTSNIDFQEFKGSLIDIDTSREYQDDYFLSNMKEEINKAHLCEKRLFFSLLKDDFIKSLNPDYDGKEQCIK